MVDLAKNLKIVHLYHKEMNIYGDRGNVMAFEYRARLRGISTDIINCGIADMIPSDVDIIVTGGGQDSGQVVVQSDLQKKAKNLKKFFNDGVICLAICGMYQLFGHEFVTTDGNTIDGISYFDMTTVAGRERLTGNVILETSFGKIVGFENHSGQTRLSNKQDSLGRVIKGNGNNAEDKSEGAILNNVFGTYLHGPILPKNPDFTDELLKRALIRKYGNAGELIGAVDNSLEIKAARVAMHRP